QVVLGREMVVQAHLGDPGLGDDSVDAYGPDAFLVEQPVGGFQDALPGLRGFSPASHARTIQTCLFTVKPLIGFFFIRSTSAMFRRTSPSAAAPRRIAPLARSSHPTGHRPRLLQAPPSPSPSWPCRSCRIP